jgi:hypothetical protein
MTTRNSPADSGGFTHVIFCFRRSQMMFGLCLRDVARRHAKHQQKCGSEDSHKHCYRTRDFLKNLADLGSIQMELDFQHACNANQKHRRKTCG